MSCFAEIALPVPMRRLFDYRVESADSVQAGVRVSVRFAHRELTGVVVRTKPNSDFDENKIKPISALLDQEPVFDCNMLKLLRWSAQYYQVPFGEVLSTALPARLRNGHSSEPQPVKYWRLAAEKQENDAPLNRAPKQLSLLHSLKKGPMADSEIKQTYAASTLKALHNKQFIEPFQRAPTVQNDWSNQLEVGYKPAPNMAQSLAITAVHSSLNQYRTLLLEGVTGSGKTEVYLQAIEPLLQQNKQVLILVPEIGLTPQTVGRFRRRFNVPVELLHSALTDNERLAVWRAARDGSTAIVIGTRSAIFTPFKQLGMIIVDEEHDGSFKQQDGFRYHARDLAVMRAKELSIPLLLGSATPALESLQNALIGRYQHLQLGQRAGPASLVAQNLFDLRDQPTRCGIANGLLDRMRQHLKQGNQVMVFLNRRGYAPNVLCHHCGYVSVCEDCERPFTLHQFANKMQCHHCAAIQPILTRCPQCHSHDIQTEGIGTEQLADQLKSIFSGFPVLRIDSDSMGSKSRLQSMLDQINGGEAQVLVGTQILAKGHHFPRVTMVVIVDVDASLFSPDFRAAEHLCQLVTQVAGRAGRAEHAGEMWLQTHHPAHPLLQDLIHNGYAHVARLALQERQAGKLPPFGFQALIRCESPHQDQAFRFLSQAKLTFAQHQSVRCIGPVPCTIEKRQGRYRMQLLLQSNLRADLQRGLFQQLPGIEQLPDANKVRWSVDVDPHDFS